MKKALLTTMAVLFSSMFVACGAENSTPASTSPSTQTEVVTPSTTPASVEASVASSEPTATVEPEKGPLDFESPVPVVTGIEAADSLLKKAYDLYVAEDYRGLTLLDSSDEASSIASSLIADHADSDRYITYLDDAKTYAMLYYEVAGGYWWYFGDIKDGAREGQGTHFCSYGENKYEIFKGVYQNDEPNGQGVYVKQWSGYQRFTGEFHGMTLNGSYECYAYAKDEKGKTICETTETVAFTNGVPDVILNDEVASQLPDGLDSSITEDCSIYMYKSEGDLLAYWHVNPAAFDNLAANPAFTK